MAIPVVESQSLLIQTTDVTSHVVTKPTGTAVGDLLLGFFAADGVPSTTHTGPSGWTQLGIMEAATSVSSSVWYIIATSTEVAASNFTFTTSISEKSVTSILRISGVDGTTPINIHAISNSVASNDPIVAPAATTTVADTLVFRHGVVRGNQIITDGGNAVGQVLDYSKETGTSNPADVGGHVNHKGQASTGTTGTSDIDILTSQTDWVTWTIAVAPTTAGTTINTTLGILSLTKFDTTITIGTVSTILATSETLNLTAFQTTINPEEVNVFMFGAIL